MAVAVAHFLALLSPGPDFFLVAQQSMSSGWRRASGACVGIGIANGVFIVVAFAGLSVLRPGTVMFTTIQCVGATFLVFLGIRFWVGSLRSGRSSASHEDVEHRADSAAADSHAPSAFAGWMRASSLGFTSAILNPKNALFYASLAAVLANSRTEWTHQVFYGLWMFLVVISWDLLVAVLIGNRIVVAGFRRALPWLERICGVALIMLGLGIAAAAMW